MENTPKTTPNTDLSASLQSFTASYIPPEKALLSKLDVSLEDSEVIPKSGEVSLKDSEVIPKSGEVIPKSGTVALKDSTANGEALPEQPKRKKGNPALYKGMPPLNPSGRPPRVPMEMKREVVDILKTADSTQ
jgi:hypothetical protein